VPIGTSVPAGEDFVRARRDAPGGAEVAAGGER